MAALVTVVAALSAWYDLEKDIIPNRLLFPGMGIGILLRVTMDISGGEPLDIFIMTAEVIILFICLWPVYVTGGLGAGDCKLLLLAGVCLPVKQAIFVVVSSFFVAAGEILLWKLIRIMRKEKKKISKIHFAPVFFTVVLIGWL